MSPADAEFWSGLLRRTLEAYDDAWLRAVAARLVRPRNQWPAAELIDRIVATALNPAVIDRRIKEMAAPARQALAVIGHSRQPCWPLGSLVETVMSLGHADGLEPLRDLVDAGLLYPTSPAALADPSGKIARLRGFDQWLAGAGSAGLLVFVPPQVAARAIGEDLGLPDLAQVGPATMGRPEEADGLEWVLRLAVLWQQAVALPLRRTQQGGFFKRDQERLAGDALLNGPAADQKAGVPDLGFLLAAFGELMGVLVPGESELRAGTIPASWEQGLNAALVGYFSAWPRLQGWNPLDGWLRPDAPAGNPFAAAGMLSLLLLARLPNGAFALVGEVAQWIQERHPYWSGEDLRPSRQKPWMDTFLLGVAYTLRLVQTGRDLSGEALVRLSPTGRWLLGLGEAPAPAPGFPQTLTVQPNLEIIAFRQGLTPALVAALSRFAEWKSLGAACTLQVGPESVYRALEAGETFESIRLTLERHSTRTLPDAVLDSLRTWADKRDRITVYPAATLLEFESAADLNDALARGVPAMRLADALAVVPSEADVDYRHFRLIGTRDYALRPEKCADVEEDGVTLVVDPARSDLLLETELPRFAEPLPGPSSGGRRYRLTPESLAAARNTGLTLANLEGWFQQRCGKPLPSAALLLMTAGQSPPAQWRRHLVLHLPSEELADGLLQWPATRELIAERLGPTAVAVAEEKAAALRQHLRELGIAEENQL